MVPGELKNADQNTVGGTAVNGPRIVQSASAQFAARILPGALIIESIPFFRMLLQIN
jgi:hypothetical protein